jgi:hypothetical protein
MGTGLDPLSFGARFYLAEFSAKARNHIRLTSVTVNVFWFEFNLALVGPVLGYPFFPLNVFRLSRFESFALVTVKSTISNHFRNHPTASLFDGITC